MMMMMMAHHQSSHVSYVGRLHNGTQDQFRMLNVGRLDTGTPDQFRHVVFSDV